MSTKRKLVSILGVPMDLGSARLGVDMGPDAVRYAGLARVLEKQGLRVEDLGNVPVPPPESIAVGNRRARYADVIAAVSAQTARKVAAAVRGGGFPLVLGGDHAVAIGSIAGARKAFGKIGVLWIDCHPDFNTSSTTITGNVHGMALAASLGEGEPSLVRIGGTGRKVAPENVCILGARDVDPGEWKLLHKTGVRVLTVDDVDEMGLKAAVDEALMTVSAGTNAVHVSLDLDSIDSQYAPGVGIRNHGGFTYREITYIMRRLGKSGVVRSLDVIELNPIADVENRTSLLAMELVTLALGAQYSDYSRYMERHRL